MAAQLGVLEGLDLRVGEPERSDDVADLVDAEAVPPGVGLAVIAGLVDDVSVEAGRDSGLVVRMTWPTT